jgi:hypothetical protein
MAKTQRFHDYFIDIERLATRVETYLADNHFEVALSKDKKNQFSSFFIQARKLGVARTAAGMRRSTDIRIEGTPDSFAITIGTGEWGNNLLVSAPLFVIPIAGIVATVARLYTAKKFEKNLWKYIKEQAHFLRDSTTSDNTSRSAEQNEFECDYVKGYPGWSAQIRNGKLILMKQNTGVNKVIFESPDGEQIAIPAQKIQKATIISRKKGLNENDLLLEITCKDKDDKTINPILNLPDNIIAGVLAGINELVAKDVYLRGFYE